MLRWFNGAVNTPLDNLIDILDLEKVEENIYRGRSPDERLQRVFGGQVAGQALVAAGRTVSRHHVVHSLHAYFLRGGDPAIPIVYTVDPTRDGRSFSVRRVVAVQHGKSIFALAASFQLPEEGFEHQDEMPEAPDPETLPTLAQRATEHGVPMSEAWARTLPIDARHVNDPPVVAMNGGPREPRQMVWMRMDGKLPDDPVLHACAITYASDMTLLDSVHLAHATSWHSIRGASLDHAMWFHRSIRADEWFLYVQESPSASGSRGFCRGQIYTRDGRLAVSVAQEGLFRLRAPG
jgi:acyl-CoA thioesterase II